MILTKNRTELGTVSSGKNKKGKEKKGARERAA
jgi:hypothetical protein